MRLRCSFAAFLFALLTSHLTAGVSLVGQVGRLFRSDATTQVPLGSVAILVADTDKGTHAGLAVPLGTTLSVGSTLGGSSGDLIVGVYFASNLGDGVVGVDLGGTTLTYSGALTAGTDLWLVWFPTITTTGGVVGAAAPYGTYRSSVVDTASGSDIAFVTPPDGVTASLYAYTSSLGFGLASNAELSATLVTPGVGGGNVAPTDLALSASTVNQAAGSNATFGTLSTTDLDSVSFTYTLVSGTGSTDNASFNLSGATLRANDAGALAPGSYSVRLQTSDGSGGTFAKAFTITVTARAPNSAPTDLALSASTINQAAGNNATIGTLSTTDSDSGSFTYALVSGTGSTHNASFNLSGATLRATDAGALAPGSYSVRVQTSDGNGGTFAKAFTITVTALVVVNAAPTDLALSASTVNQAAGANATVGTLTTTDGDSASFTYTFVSGTGSTHNASFNLSGATLRATDAPSLAPGAYSVRLQTADGSGGTFEKAFTITVTARDYSGAYFGTLGTAGGHWALDVNSDGTGTYIAYLPDRHSAIVVHLTIDSLGRFTVTGSEIVPLAAGDLRGALSMSGAGSAHGEATATAFTLTGQISGNSVSGQLTGLGVSFTGSADTGSGSTAAGFYTASAIGATSGTTYAIVGPSGQTVVVTTSPTSVDGASGTVNNSGQLSATTAAGAALALTVNPQSQSAAATVTPVGSSTPVAYAGLADTAVNTSRLVNIATRAYCSTGNNVTIGGFVIAGSGTKRVLVRAVGPSLVSQGIGQSEVLLDPVIEVHQGSPIIASNDNWAENANASEIASVGSLIGARSLDSGDAKSSALLLTLSPGVYSFIVSGKAGSSGIVLLEVYDADTGTPTAEFVNIATRAYATTGNGVTIGGFVLSGNAPKRVLLRGVGPTLLKQGIGQSEVLVDPSIEVHQGSPIIANNDNSADNANVAEIGTTGSRIGATPLDGADTKSSAVLLTLQPGAYSFIASGKASTSGIVLVEVYDAD